MYHFDYEIIEIQNKKYFKKKVLIVNEENLFLLENEFNKLNLLKEYDFFPRIIDFNKDEKFILYEYIDGINLKDKTFFSKENVIKFLINLCNMLEVLHNHNIVHCDLKPNNIMIDKYGKMFLIDFGISSFIGEKINYATLRFCPIEQISEKIADVYYDIYAFGIIMYQLFTGKKIFEKEKKQKILSEKKNLYLSLKNILGAPILIEKIINNCIHNQYKNISALKEDLLLLKEQI